MNNYNYFVIILQFIVDVLAMFQKLTAVNMGTPVNAI